MFHSRSSPPSPSPPSLPGPPSRLRRPAARQRSLHLVGRVFGYPPAHNAGSEWMLHSMLRPLIERGHQVSIYLSHPGKIKKAYDFEGVRVIPFQQSAAFAAAAQQTDVLLSHYENVPVVAGLARARATPTVVLCHDNFATTFHNAAGADLVVYNSQWIRREAEVHYARYPDNLMPGRAIVVRPPVTAADYATRPRQQRDPGQPQSGQGCGNVLAGGRLVPQVALPGRARRLRPAAQAPPPTCPTARSSTACPATRCARRSTPVPGWC
ncbi:glycosyltransferase [Streptomyces sp. NPDC046939]|uniref:glycosyltransferase n=1 Tax=Streptomyces sp. NPDC046939 TaxID=3155376 RepID=UPI0033CDF56A